MVPLEGKCKKISLLNLTSNFSDLLENRKTGQRAKVSDVLENEILLEDIFSLEQVSLTEVERNYVICKWLFVHQILRDIFDAKTIQLFSVWSKQTALLSHSGCFVFGLSNTNYNTIQYLKLPLLTGNS